MANSKCRWECPEQWSDWSEWLAAGLHARNRWRWPVLLAGMLFAGGRHTMTSWLRAANVSDDFQDYYYFLACVGRKSESIATQLVIYKKRSALSLEKLRAQNQTRQCHSCQESFLVLRVAMISCPLLEVWNYVPPIGQRIRACDSSARPSAHRARRAAVFQRGTAAGRSVGAASSTTSHQSLWG